MCTLGYWASPLVVMFTFALQINGVLGNCCFGVIIHMNRSVADSGFSHFMILGDIELSHSF